MIEIRESQIEDILVTAPTLIKTLLNLEDEPRLLVRQMVIPSGRLDLLYTYQTKLLLIELKIVAFMQKFIGQVLTYRCDLQKYQADGKLVTGEILPYLLCPLIPETGKEMAKRNGIIGIEYNPELVLQSFYQNFKPIASLAEVKPIDIGIWNLHLMHSFIYFLERTNSVTELRKIVGGSSRTLYNKIKFASELRLVNWKPNSDEICLSEFGRKYIQYKDAALPERLSERQAKLLKDFVIKNPYESSVILGIASVVESVFALAKNTYPVPMQHLTEYFSFYAGKYFDWQTDKAKYSATRMYSNYAVDLGLLGKTGDVVFITPDGLRFTVQMQLHKSLRTLESLKLA